MATNISNKIAFCRQYFPELKIFLEDFDISDTDNGYNNTLSMHLLLDAYNDYKLDPKYNKKLSENSKEEEAARIRNKRRRDFRWKLAPVKEVDLMLAIEEFYEITNPLEKNREKLIDYLLYPSKDKYYSIDDVISKAIFVYFGFMKPSDANTLGEQNNLFTNDKGTKGILKNLISIKKDEECFFTECFDLLNKVRNLVHSGKQFEEHTKDLYHKFVVFTYIGLTYFCRRLWKKYEGELENPSYMGKKYRMPPAIKDFVMPGDIKRFIVRTDGEDVDTNIVKVEIKKGGSSEWTPIPVENGSLPSKECHFVIDGIRKYEPFTIKIIYSDDKQETEEKVPIIPDYYSFWGDFVEIIQPRNVRPFIGIAGGNEKVENEMTKLFNKVNKLTETKSEELKRFIVLGYFSKLAPVLRTLEDLQKGGNRQKEEQEIIQNQLLSSIDDFNCKFDARLDMLSKKMDDLSEKMDGHADKQTNQYNELIELIKKHLTVDEDRYGVIIEIAKNYLAEIEKQNKKSKRNRAICGVLSVFILASLIYVISFTHAMEFFMTPEEVCAKGDELFRKAFVNGISHDEPHSFREQESRFIEAAATYRRAIKKYEDILAKDSLDVDANIGLAKMLMRGKGQYDPFLAERYAKRVANDRNGEGLYLYLLFYNGKISEAEARLRKIDTVLSRDEYMELVDALLKIYGTNNGSAQEIQGLIYKIMDMGIPEARLWFALIHKTGIKAQGSSGTSSYLIHPSPLESAFTFNGLARLFDYPWAMTQYSNFLEGIGQFEMSITSSFFAEICGIKESAPITWYKLLKYFDIEKSGPEKRTLFEKVARETRRQGGLPSEFVGFWQSIYNLNVEDVNEAKRLLIDLDSLLALVKKSHDVYIKDETLGTLYGIQVSLNLIAGDYSTATNLAMKLDDCSDSIAVSDYLMGVCYAEGYGANIKDSLKSDSLIRQSADRGYIGAIFTQLKKGEPIGKWVIEKQWETSLNDKETKQKAGVSQPHTNDIILGVGGQISTFQFSKYANIPDSIWQKSPLLSMILDNYWAPYYVEMKNEISPYSYYCPKEYQIMCEVRSAAFEYKDAIWILKELPKAVEEDLITKLDIGLTYAIDNKQSQIALIMIAMRDELIKDYNNYDNSRYITKKFVDFILEDFKVSGGFDLTYKMTYPLYAY